MSEEKHTWDCETEEEIDEIVRNYSSRLIFQGTEAHFLITNPNTKHPLKMPKWSLTVSNKENPPSIKIYIENPPAGMAEALEKILKEYIP